MAGKQQRAHVVAGGGGGGGQATLGALAKVAGTAGKRGAPVLLDGVHLCQAWLQHHGAPDQAVFDVDRLSQPDIAALAAAVPDSPWKAGRASHSW
ncbi:hypothetical protein G6F24_018359 [Rhizopus arrhizus]|nr:hypothetical protein G6F24_018359 [Rhizopus arrhizus]